jgi:hypothetical protein
MMPPEEDPTPAKDGFVMFLSFIVFGLIPVIRKSLVFDSVDDVVR